MEAVSLVEIILGTAGLASIMVVGYIHVNYVNRK